MIPFISKKKRDQVNMSSTDREFDLNIEKILENWDVHHAIREIIANAIDEQILTNTGDIEVNKKENTWYIRDYGRGLSYHHLTQNENHEKLNNDNLIGRFGVGLKDALATLHRNNVEVTITSKNGIFTVAHSNKKGFEDINTLHASIKENADNDMIGTEFALIGCNDKDIYTAKALFLKFVPYRIIEETRYGEILDMVGGNIYINGLKVAEEPNFLFSYNITSLTKQIKKALNRERTNVGRVAYSERVKSILLLSKGEEVTHKLADDLQKYSSGLMHDELAWNDIALFAAKKIGELKEKVVFVPSDIAINEPEVIDTMRNDGREPFILPKSIIEKIESYNNEAPEGTPKISTKNEFLEDLARKRVYDFLDPAELTLAERKVYDKKDAILSLIGGKPSKVKSIVIANKIYESQLYSETVGLWSELEGLIIIKRNQLRDIESFARTLIHECIHAKSGYNDVNRDFESALCDVIGVLAAKIVN